MTTDPSTYAALARQTAETAGRLWLLAEVMDTASFHVGGWPPARLKELATTLRGTALRAAMAADDVNLLNELSGREWTALHNRPETPL